MEYREKLRSALNQFILSEDTPCFDYEMLGAAKYLKIIARAFDDETLLAEATDLEVSIQKSLEQEDKDLDDHYDLQVKVLKAREDIKQLCIDLFYHQGVFAVPMDAYADMIASLGDNQTVECARLRKYVDENNVLDKAYNQTKRELQGRIMRENSTRLPGKEEVVRVFEGVKNEIYHRADIHIPRQLNKIK